MRMLTGFGAALFSPLVGWYIRRQQNRLAPLATPLTGIQMHAMKTYFSSALLESVRVLIAETLPIPDPPLLDHVRRLGFAFARPSLTQAVTFGHLIAARDDPDASTLFHELVHVVQFDALGIRRFAQEYVRGFLESRDYFSIPLERCAFELQSKYEAGNSFDAEAEIRRYLGAD